MKAIGSNDTVYLVHVRGMDKPVRLMESAGRRLADYLVGDNINQFVEITDLNQIRRVIRTSTIDRVELLERRAERYKTPQELGLPVLTN